MSNGTFKIKATSQRSNVRHRPERWNSIAVRDALEFASVERAPCRILLAEDDDDMRNLVANALRDEGFQVLEARDGDALAECITCELLLGDGSHAIDLIITDVRMPGTSGLSVLEGLRRVDGHIPVILITAFGCDALHDEARRLGATAVLNKPFDMKELRELARSATA